MAYPGNPDLSSQAQDRVMTAFKQVVGKLQQGNREEALIGLEFVLRLDPAYAPARSLHQQLSSGATEIDLNDVLTQLQAPTTDTINNLLVEAVEAFDERDFEGARARVDQVLLDLPGHEEARFLLAQIDEATKGESQVSQFLRQAQEALDRGDSQEAAKFVTMAQALDPHHRGIAETIALIDDLVVSSSPQEELSAEGAVAPAEAEVPDTVGFDTLDDSSDLFSDTEHESPPIGTEGASVFEDTSPPQELSTPQPPPPDGPRTESTQPAKPEPLATEAAPTNGYYQDDESAADLLETGAAASASGAEAVDVDPSDPQAVIRDLLAKGGAAAAADNYAAAIDAWSRILLIDHKHEEALDRIEHIRHAKEDIDRRIEPMLEDARSSHLNGDIDMAKDFVRRVLELSPNHVEGTRLREAIQRGAHPDSEEPVADEAMPDLEEDLFMDEFDSTPDLDEEIPIRQEEVALERPKVEKPKRKIPWQRGAVIGAAGLAIVAVAMWFGGVFAPAPEGEPRITVVNRVLVEARDMYEQKRVEEAILHLEQNSADDEFQVRIDKALANYRAAVATPGPTPIPEGLTISRDLLAAGRWMAAYERVMAELKTHPGDLGLEEVRAQVLELEPAAAGLHDAVKSGDYSSALTLSKTLLDTRADDPEVTAVYDRLLFNAALAELRAFNLVNSETHLKELQQRNPEDEEVKRILAFVDTYKTRPVDMQLEIFVGSLSER
jgi:tetratricopeptide (TPR) repeat protein